MQNYVYFVMFIFMLNCVQSIDINIFIDKWCRIW